MEAINYLLNFIFDTLLMILILRIWLQLVRADFYNPLCQFIVKVSNPLVIPFRKVIPGLGGIDVATILVAYIVACSKFVIIPLINGGAVDIITALIIGGAYLIKETGVLMFIIMLVMALMSWIVQGYNPTMAVFHQLTAPILKPIQRIIPSIGGLDLSVLVAFLALNMINIFLSGLIPFWQHL